MMAFRVRLEKLSTRQFQQIENSDNQHDSLHFCQILHYTRKNPKTGEIAPIPMWMRSICPWDLTRSSNEVRIEFICDFSKIYFFSIFDFSGVKLRDNYTQMRI